jgi:hypothetical protein
MENLPFAGQDAAAMTGASSDIGLKMAGIGDPITILSCEQAVLRLYHALDQGDYGAVLAQFAAEGTWKRGNVLLKGHQQILASLEKRSATQVIRHVASNFLWSARDGGGVMAAFHLTVYHFDAGVPAALPVAIARPFLFGDATCQLACGDDGCWRIRHMAFDRVFEFPV